MRKLLLLLSTMLPMLSSAYDAEIDGIYYNFSGNEATVTYQTYQDYTYFSDYSGSIVISKTVTYNGTVYNVTSIGSNAFRDCSGLTTVTIPNSVTSIGSNAFDGCSGLTTITIPNSVTRIGKMAFYGCSGLTSITIPNSVTSIGNEAFFGCWGLTSVNIFDIAAWCKIAFSGEYSTPLSCAYHLYLNGEEIKDLVIPNGVTSIGDWAFFCCSGLTSVTIPNSVTSIGSCAFYKCAGLKSVTIPNSVKSIGNDAFGNCSGLTDITIGSGVTSIGSNAFRDCSGLTTVTIPNSVTSIGSYAFYGCSGLTSVTFHCKKIDSGFSGNAFIKEVVFGDEVTSIGKNAFDGCSGLTSITIPQSMKSIGSNAFTGCYFASDSFVNYSSLTSNNNWGAILCDEETGDGVLIKNNVAVKCRPGATSATIPNSVTSIGASAFNGCYILTSVTISNSVTNIGENAFYGCSNLTEIHISDIAAWCEIEFATNVFSPLHGYHLFLNDKEIKDLVIPDGVTKIGLCAFRSFIGLTSVTIPGSITSLSEGAFSRCSGLTSVNMTEGLTTIGNYAFDYCSSLTSITIPSSVTKIGNYAFQYCTGLTDVICYATRPPYASYNTFDNSHYENTTLHVPGGYIKFYKSSWSEFKSIKPIDGLDNYAILDGICYAFSENDAEVSYADEAYSGDAVIPETVTHNGKTYNVTSIGYSAFSGCSGLTSITIPNSVTEIGEYVFYGCSGLTSITIPNSVTSIGRYAFSGCSGLTSVIIGNSVTSIGDYAFVLCSGLTSVTIGNSVTEIGYATFRSCSGLKSVTIPNSVTSIGIAAFEDCSGLTSVTIGNSVTSIGGSAFSGCSGLTSVTIPNSVTSIDYYAFRDCISMTSVTIGSGVTSIGNSAFSGCTNLIEIHISDIAAWCGIENVGSAFSYDHGYHLFLNDEEIKDLVIPDGVTKIGSCAFRSFTGLTSVTIPNSVTSIGGSAFYGCTALSSVTLESDAIVSATRTPTTSMKTIFGEQVQTYILGDAVTSVGVYAFYSCKALTDVFCYAENVPTAKSNTFNSSPVASATLHVPAASLEAYKTTSPWSKFGTIVAITEAIAEETTVNPAETAKPGSATTTEDVTTSLSNDDEVDIEEGSVTMHTTMSTEEVQTLIENSNPGSPEFNEGFKGMYFLLAAGKGKIELDIETQGNYLMSVMQGSILLGNYAQSTKGTITIEYDIDADTWFFAYPAVSTPSSIRRANAADTDGALKVYSIRIIPEEIYDPDGIRTIDNEQLTIDDVEYYDLNGRKIISLPSGRSGGGHINIIRHSDGTSKKVLIK